MYSLLNVRSLLPFWTLSFRYWRPGPRANPVTDTKYITYGFAYIQDMVDHAIINVQTQKQVEIGVETQQFP